MSRTIRLSRIHALNWYGYKDSIPVEGNLLLAGVTGSGKSILMDLIQLVLVGDQRLIRFNQSATGDRSDRSLKGYCLGDTKQEENGVAQFMRQSAITYVALEFTWPSGRKAETWGLRVEFHSAAETQGKVTPFFIPTKLERSDFLDTEKRPLDYTAFKAFAEARNGRLFTEGLDAYLRDMAQPAHLNFDRNILRSLLPTAMSFTFLKSFNDFCRHFILPDDKLDVSDVTSSYRTFLSYERDLTELNDQFEKLKVIRETFTRLTDLRRDRALARYLEAQLRHEHAAEQLAADEIKLSKLREEYAVEERRLLKLDELIERGRTETQQIAALIHQTPEGQLYSFIKSRNVELTWQISQLTEIGNTLEQALTNRVRNARSWLKQLRALPLEFDATPANAVERAIHDVEAGDISNAGETLRVLADSAQRAAAEASRAANPTQKRLAEIRQQLGQLRDEIGALKLGKLPFPTRLLDALNNSLFSGKTELPAQSLCKLCEVLDERWRPAIEIAFTRKFAVLVTPEDYEQAEKIYHNLKASELGNEIGRESLINPAKALKAKREIRPGSLAAKIKTSHPVAEAIISNLFGDVTCVERREQLREHDFAILPDGFMTRGAFVERPRFYDGNPFVGKEGLRQQLAWKEKQRDELEIEERRLKPIEIALKTLNEGWREYFDLSPSLYSDLARARELPKLQTELKGNITKLNSIDRSKFDELAKQQAKLETDLAAWTNEQRGLLQSPKRQQVQGLDSAVICQRKEVEGLANKFQEICATDISLWLKHLEELRSQMLGEFPGKDVAADKFNGLFHDCREKAAAAWEELKSNRIQLALAHPKFDDLPIESESNEGHEKQLVKLEQSEIPEYKTKAERERKHWEGLFRNQVLDKLSGALGDVRNLLFILNQELRKRPIGNDRYQISYRQNPDFKIWHELVEANTLAHSDELWFASADPRFRDAIERFLKTLTEQSESAEAARLLDYRNYYEYDMDVEDETGRKTSVDRHSGKFSGGENQSPYFIAILASYLRAYRRYGSRKQEPSLGLVPIDEAFSKLSGERIKDCITALKAFDLQGVFSMSTGNIPYAFEHCDWLVVVSKEERRTGKRMEIRNIPVSLARDSEDARRLMDK
ncbi:MAG: SbcC/MukB-like Walker B domain-containing protein [Verrucomicrobiota bacterium]